MACSEMEPQQSAGCPSVVTHRETLTGVTQPGFLSSLVFSSEKATASIELCVAMRHHFCDTVAVMGISCSLQHCE